VNVEADLIAKGAISLGGVKRTSWPSGGSGSVSGSQCYSVQRVKPGSLGVRENNLCASIYEPDSELRLSCSNPTSHTTYTELINDWCSIEKGGCTITLFDALGAENGGDYISKEVFYYNAFQIASGRDKWYIFRSPDSGDINIATTEPYTGHTSRQYPGTNPEVRVLDVVPNHPQISSGSSRCSLSYDDGVNDPYLGGSFNGFYLYMDRRNSGSIEWENGCVLTICNNG